MNLSSAAGASEDARVAEAAEERPYLLAFASVVAAMAVLAGVGLWALARPEQVIVGRAGRHDGVVAGERHAACLDCHVPFVGTPASRCLGPSCHGELATGSPPKAGPAMPVRFHVALRDEPCERCHKEHDDRIATRTASRAFSHEIIPLARKDECRRCHIGTAIGSHSRTDAVACQTCHGQKSWTGDPIDHAKVAATHCDVCHLAPKIEAHAAIAGTCSTCHEVATWTPKI